MESYILLKSGPGFGMGIIIIVIVVRLQARTVTFPSRTAVSIDSGPQNRLQDIMVPL